MQSFVLEDEGSLEMDGDDGNSVVPMYLMLLICTLKMLNIMLCAFYHTFQK